MGRKKIQIRYIKDTRLRRVTFKKRKIGLLKKAIELSRLTGLNICLKVYNPENQSLTEYQSHPEVDKHDCFKPDSHLVKKYTKYLNDDYEKVDELESNIKFFEKRTHSQVRKALSDDDSDSENEVQALTCE